MSAQMSIFAVMASTLRGPQLLQVARLTAPVVLDPTFHAGEVIITYVSTERNFSQEN